MFDSLYVEFTTEEIKTELDTLDFGLSLVNISTDKYLVRMNRQTDIHKLYKVSKTLD